MTQATQIGEGVDYSRYREWQKVTAPNGAVYYKVPNTGYLFDPFASAAKGRPVLYTDPSPQVTERQKAEQERQDAINAQKQAASPMGQILPVVGSTAGVIGANYAVNALKPATAIGAVNTATGPAVIMSDGSIAGQAANTATQAATQVAATTPAQAFAGAVQAPVGDAVATSMGNGILTTASPEVIPGAGAVTPPVEGIGITPYLGVAGAALGGYGLYNAIKAHDSKSAFLSGAGLGGGLAAAAPLLGFTPLGWAGLGLAALGGGAFGLGAESLLGHKTTKEYEAERWGGLQENGVNDANAAFQANHPDGDTGVWQTGKYAGKKWNFTDALDLAKDDPSQFRLVFGNYQTFGNDWAKYSPAQQDAIVRELINQGLYKSDHGDILITNENKAREIKDQILAGNQTTTAVNPQVATNTQGQTTVNPVAPVTAPPQAQTNSQWQYDIRLPQPTTPMVITNKPNVTANIPGGAAIIGKQLADRINARR